MKWNVLIIFVLISFAAPARAGSSVSGESIEIVKARGAAELFRVTTAHHGDIYAGDVRHCGAPAVGSAYLQSVTLSDGTEYRTLYASNCAYEAWSF